jgi:hypothetical protein
MPYDQTQVKFGGDIGELVTAMNTLSDQVQSSLAKVNANLDTFNSAAAKASEKFVEGQRQIGQAAEHIQNDVVAAFSKIQTVVTSAVGVIGSLSGALAGGAAFSGIISSTEKWTTSARELSQVMGVTTEQASVYNVAMQLIGKTSDDFQNVLLKLNRQLKTNEEGVNALGIATRDATTGAFRPMMDIFQDSITVMMSYKAGFDRDQAATFLFGRSVKEVLDYQRLTNDTLKEATRIAEQYGLTVTRDGVQTTREYKLAMVELNLATEGVMHKVAEFTVPILTEFAKTLLNTGKVVDEVKVKMTNWGGVIDSVKNKVGLAAQEMKDLYAAAENVMGLGSPDAKTGPMFGPRDLSPGGLAPAQPQTNRRDGQDSAGDKSWAPPTDIVEQREAQLQQIMDSEQNFYSWSTKQDYEYWNNVLATDTLTAAQRAKVWEKMSADLKSMAAENSKASSGGDKSDVVQQWQQELDNLKSLQQNWTTWSVSKDYEFWNEKLAKTREGTAEWYSVMEKMGSLWQQMTEMQEKELAQQAKNEEAISAGRAAMARDDAQTAIKLEEGKISTLYNLGKISASQKYELLKQEYDKEYQLEVDAYYQELAKLQERGEATLAQQVKVWEQIEKAHNQYLVKMQKDEDSYLAGLKTKWDGYATMVGNELTSVLFSHQTMLQTMQKLTERAFSYLIDTALKGLVNAWIKSEAAKTAATTAGTAARTTAETAGESAGFMAKISMSLKSIMADASKAAAGAYAAVADIPIIGPILAPEAAAVAFAAVAAFGSGLPSAAGGWEVPQDTLAMVHKNEMILPADISGGLKGMIGQGGGSGDLHVFNPQFHFNGDRWEDGIKRNPDALFRAIEKGIRNHHFRWNRA